MKTDQKVTAPSERGKTGKTKANRQAAKKNPLPIMPGENEYDLFFDLVPDLVCVASTDGYFKKLNPAWEKTLGFSMTELLSQPFANFIHPDDIEPTNREVARQIGGENTINFINRYRTKSGAYRWLEWHATPAAAGTVLYAAARDITDRKQAEEELRISQGRFWAAMEISQDGLWDLDLQTGSYYYSPALFRLLGYQVDEFPTQIGSWMDLIHPSDLPKVRSANLDCIENRSERFDTEFRMQSQAGRWKWMLGKGRAVRRGLDGKALRMIGTLTDISEHKQMDETLRQSELELREAQSIAHLGSWKWDIRNGEVSWSDEMFRIFGIDQQAYTGRLGDVISKVIHPDDLQVVLPSNAATIANEPFTYRIILPDGSIRHIWAKSGNKILDSDGKPIFLTGVAQDITERKLGEEALSENEEKQRMILGALLDNVVLLDAEGKIQYINHVSAGLDPQDVIGSKWNLWLDENDQEMAAQALRETIASGLPAEIEYRAIGVGREMTWFHVKMARMPEATAQQKVVLVASDISERRRAEEALLRANQRLALAQRSAKAGVWNWEIVTGSLYWSSELFELFGLEPEANPTLETWRNILHPEDRQSAEDKINQAMQLHIPLDSEYRIIGLDSELRWISALGDSIYDLDGKPIRMSGICIDITARKRAEEDLLESEARLRGYFEQDLIGVAITSPEKGWLDVNPAVCSLLGYSRDELFEKTWDELTHPDDLEKDLENFTRILSGEIDGYRMEKRFIRSDGQTIDIDLGVRCKRKLDGSVDYFMALLSDISERKTAEVELLRYRDHLEALVNERTAELEIAKEQAESANRAKSDFLAVMSHEIRTPLNGVLGLTSLALQTELNPKQQDYLTHIQASGEALLTIINDILDFSKIESGKFELESIDFDLDDVLHSLANLMAYRAQEKGLELVFNSAPGIPHRLVGDPGRLRQIILNLVSNAIKFTDSGEIVVKVRLLGVTTGQAVLEFSIRDTGIGMNAQQKAQLFEPFFQADSSTSRKYGGTGLGLTICKRLIVMMDGEIRVESQPDQGSNFSFTVRLKCQEQVKEDMLTLMPDLVGLRVLVVENNVEVLGFLESSLTAMSFKVRTVTNDEAGLLMLDASDLEQGFDLIIIDRGRAGGVDVDELVRKVRDMPGQADLPVILLTPAEEKGLRLELSGRNAVLVKPVTSSSLFDAVMQVFGHSNQPQKWLQPKALRLDALESVRGRRLLVVEDNEINQLVAREMLENAGLKATIARNGQEALEMLQAEGFDAVLMDIQMPGMDGYEATRRIRADVRYGFDQLPIIAMTAHALSGDRETVLSTGMNDYVSKPIDAGQLREALLRWLQPMGEGISGAKPRQVGLESADVKSQMVAEKPAASRDRPGLVELDTRAALERLDNNQLLYKRLLRLARKNHVQSGAEIRAAVEMQDIALAHRLAHSLKGLAGTIGAPELREAALRLELVLAKRAEPQYESLLAELEARLSEVMATLEIMLED